jgi:hypothetical protein
MKYLPFIFAPIIFGIFMAFQTREAFVASLFLGFGGVGVIRVEL